MLFICYGLWQAAFKWTFPLFKSMPIERVVWFLPAFWTGVLFNETIDKIPVDRLLVSDIKGRPGALTSVIIVGIVVLIIVVNQARVIRKSGWLLSYLAWYTLVIVCLVIVAVAVPSLQFRFHHYFFAMALLPLTAFPTRLSVLYQGLLLGIFLQGAAKWGFDSIFQTVSEVRIFRSWDSHATSTSSRLTDASRFLLQLRRDAPLGSSLPTFLTNSTNFNATLPLLNRTLSWLPISSQSADLQAEGWDGFSLLVDDVERYAGSVANYSLDAMIDLGVNVTNGQGLVHFFRLAVSPELSWVNYGWLLTRIVIILVSKSWSQWRLYKGCGIVAEWNLGRSTSRALLGFTSTLSTSDIYCIIRTRDLLLHLTFFARHCSADMAKLGVG